MEFYVQRNEVRLFCRRTGNGPLLLLIHGIGCDSGFFDAAAEILSQEFTVVTYDRRGYGRSSFSEGCQNHFGLKQQVEDAAAILRTVDLGPALVAASSAGGLIGLALVAEYPSLVSLASLHEPPVLLDNQTTGHIPEFNQWLNEMKEAALKGSESRMLQSFLRAMGGTDPDGPATDLIQLQTNIQYLKQFMNIELNELFLDQKASALILEGMTVKGRPVSDKVIVSIGTCDCDGIFHRTGKLFAETMGMKLLYIQGFHNAAREQPESYVQMIRGIQKQLESKH